MIARRNCATCFRIRLFLGVGLVLIVMIYLQPGGITRLAAQTPSSGVIAAAMMVAGTVGFLLRYRSYKAGKRR